MHQVEVELKSKGLGSELFTYDTVDEATAGFMRLVASAARCCQQDRIQRTVRYRDSSNATVTIIVRSSNCDLYLNHDKGYEL